MAKVGRPTEKTIDDVLEDLGIKEYKERIINSHSKGELFYIHDYFLLTHIVGDAKEFKEWFEKTVKYAEKNWKRPESVFQHILKAYIG